MTKISKVNADFLQNSLIEYTKTFFIEFSRLYRYDFDWYDPFLRGSPTHPWGGPNCSQCPTGVGLKQIYIQGKRFIFKLMLLFVHFQYYLHAAMANLTNRFLWSSSILGSQKSKTKLIVDTLFSCPKQTQFSNFWQRTKEEIILEDF